MEQIKREFFVTGCMILDNLSPPEYVISAIGTKRDYIRLQTSDMIPTNTKITVIVESNVE